MKIFNLAALASFAFGGTGFFLEATPSTTYWTVCTTDVQATDVIHVGVDSYFSVFNRRRDGSSLPTDVGLTYGLFKKKWVQSEVGVDYLGPSNDPMYFNAKIGIAENQLFSNAPAVNIGIFNVGTRCRGHDRTNQNIVDLIVGHSLPEIIGGRIFIAGFSGSRAMGKHRQGFMVAYDRAFLPEKDCDGKEYHRLVLAADYASGKNTIGGGGVGLYYYFTPNISLLTGPVFFNDASLNGKWKWTIQLDINQKISSALHRR